MSNEKRRQQIEAEERRLRALMGPEDTTTTDADRLMPTALFRALITPPAVAKEGERAATLVHHSWVATKLAQGITSRPSEWGEEQMVPYAELSERAKDLDRGTVRAVLAALEEPADA